MKLRTLDLFAGIGGFAYGLEKTGGFEAAAFCEIEPYARAVLRKHWPDVRIYDDVRSLTVDRLAADGIAVDVITGGFPCQDISLAGKGAGLAGERSGLWHEFHRLIGEIRPRYAIIENVSALRSRGLEVVLGGLAALGYDAEWHCISAAAVGAPHIRDRLWIVAYPVGEQLRLEPGRRCGQDGSGAPLVAEHGSHGNVAHPDSQPPFRPAIAWQERDPWPPEPAVCRVADGVPHRLDRLRCLGNAVVPAIPEMIGDALLVRELFA